MTYLDMRKENDNYPTPVEEAVSILHRLSYQLVIDMPESTFLDPACGEGNLHKALAKCCVSPLRMSGIEINPELASKNETCPHIRVGDALSMAWPEADVIFMNPPYSHAFDFVKKAVGSGAIVIALLRLSFMGSQSRAEFHRRHPSHVYVIPKRIKFVGNSTDTTDSAWFVFKPQFDRGRWEVLQ